MSHRRGDAPKKYTQNVRVHAHSPHHENPLYLPRATASLPSPEVTRGDAEHPLAHQRGPRAGDGLLRRQARDHARMSMRSRRKGMLLQARVVDRAGLRAGAHRHHLRHVSRPAAADAHALAWCRCRRDEDVSPVPPRGRLLLHATTQERLQPARAGPASGTSHPTRPTGKIAPRASPSSPSSTPPRATRARSAPGPHKPITIPAKVRVPAYHPDTPEVRAGLGAVLRPGQRGRRRRRPRLRELAAAGPGGRHDRLLLRRPRHRHAAQQTLAL